MLKDDSRIEPGGPESEPEKSGPETVGLVVAVLLMALLAGVLFCICAAPSPSVQSLLDTLAEE